MLGIEKDSERYLEILDMYHKALLKHRTIPGTPDNVWPEWNEKEGIIDCGESERMRKLIEEDGFNNIRIPFLYRDEPEKCKSYLAAMAKWLRKLGYLHIATIALKDEPNTAKHYEIVRKEGALIKSADPEIRRICFEQPLPTQPEWGNLYEAVDIWCPLFYHSDAPSTLERFDKGEELWTYIALNQGPSNTPWWQIDTNPLNYRSPFWLSWKFKVTGLVYWSSTCWSSTYETLQGV